MTEAETLQAAKEAYLEVVNKPDEDYIGTNKEGQKDFRWVKITRREYDALLAMHDVLFPDVEKVFRYDDTLV